jgi:fatty acid desaturase
LDQLTDISDESLTTGRIPGALNIAISILAFSVAGFALWAASNSNSWLVILLAAIIFSFVNNTIFSLLHEAVHGLFHTNQKVNEVFGSLCAAFFPTALSFQRICHLGHHRRNRSDAELFDYYFPDDNKLLKYTQWYGILTGVYWIMPPLGCLLYLIAPWALNSNIFRGKNSKVAQQSGVDAMLSGFDEVPGGRIRLEIMASILLQVLLVLALDLTFAGWIICYAAFALNWSALQYADHAWTERHVRNGAWNLRVNRPVQYLFLNYHHHKAHHQNTNVSWLDLPQYVDYTEHRPSFLAVYRNMWLGPRPYPEVPAGILGKDRC